MYSGGRAEIFLFKWKLCGDKTAGKGEKDGKAS